MIIKRWKRWWWLYDELNDENDDLRIARHIIGFDDPYDDEIMMTRCYVLICVYEMILMKCFN